MPSPTSKGSTELRPVTPDEINQQLKSLGHANFVPRALHDGVLKDGGTIGVRDAVYAILAIPQPAPATMAVKHTLGRIPAIVRLVQTIAPEGVIPPHISIAAANYAQWTDTEIRVDIQTAYGSADNCQVYLEVSGHRP